MARLFAKAAMVQNLKTGQQSVANNWRTALQQMEVRSDPLGPPNSDLELRDFWHRALPPPAEPTLPNQSQHPTMRAPPPGACTGAGAWHVRASDSIELLAALPQ